MNSDHSEVIENASKQVRQLLAEQESDGWTFQGEQKHVKVYEKKIPGRDLGILKGTGKVLGFSPIELLPITQLPECRLVWDKMYLEGKAVKALKDSAFLSYAATKPQFPVSSRDFVVVIRNEYLEDGSIYSIAKSVEDPSLPEVKGRVRGNLNIMAWCLVPLKGENGTQVTYITDLNLNGWIPASILKMAASQIPMVVADIRWYANKFFPPAFPAKMGGSAVGTPQFSHESSKLDIDFVIDTSKSLFTEFTIHKKRYPNGATITVTPAEGLTFEVNDKRNLVIRHGDEMNGKQIKIIIEKNSVGNSITVNGQALEIPSIATQGAGEAAPSSTTEFAETPAAATPSFAPTVTAGSELLDLLTNAQERLDRIEKLTQKRADTNPVTMGSVFLIVAPIAAILLARFIE